MKKKTWNKNKKKKTMQNSYETIQTRKLISSYGGAGSIIETRDGAIIVEPFSEWNFFKDYKLYHDKRNWINDKRFICRLKTWFKKLEALVEIPENDLQENGYPDKSAETISAKYFPEWMFCPKCKRFDKLENWHKHWNNEKAVTDKDKDRFFPPKCFACYSKEKNKKYRFTDLEQIRFVLTSPNGNIADVPWDRWVFAEIKGKKNQENENLNEEQIEENEKRKFLDFDKDIRTDIYFTYEVSDQYNNFQGISIIARDIDNSKKVIGRKTLKGIHSLRVHENNVVNSYSNALMKVVIRSSNSVYYPNILQSLFLPPSEELDDFSDDEIEYIKKQHKRDRTLDEICENLEDAKEITRTPEQIQKLIENDFLPESNLYGNSNLEQDYRLSEYNFIVSKKNKYQNEDAKLSIEMIENNLFDTSEIANIYRIDSLKMTVVQVSFTRQEPIDTDFFLQEDGEIKTKEGQFINKKYTSKWGKSNTTHLPAVANIGEGIFIDFNNEKISKWIEGNEKIQERANIIQKNFDETKLNQKEERIISPKFILLHTFSHLIIKELEFLSGYPATSLHERLYISEEMQGILIYTIAGAEGSYGGLVSVCKSKKIGEIIKSALHRATDCSSDPICYQTKEQGQGVGGTNIAACYSCALLPETSCEEFNRFLDRKLLIDEVIGYFKGSR